MTAPVDEKFDPRARLESELAKLKDVPRPGGENVWETGRTGSLGTSDLRARGLGFCPGREK